jgi:hypothetical protein
MNKNILKINIQKEIIYDQLKRVDFILFITVLTYILIQIIIFIKNQDSVPQAPILFFNYFFILFYFFIFFINRVTLKIIHFFILVSNIILGSMLYIHYIDIGLPYGYDAADAYFYEMVSKQTVGIGLYDFFKWVRFHIKDFSDWGFVFFRFVLGKVTTNSEAQIYLLILVNCIFYSLALKRFGDLLLIDFDKKLVKIVIFLLGINSYSIYIHASGLKENIFLFFIISSFYFLRKINVEFSAINVVIFSINVFIVSTFRWYVALFFLVILFYNFVKKFSLVNILLPFSLLILILAGAFISNVTEFFKIQEGQIYIAKSLQQYRIGTFFGLLSNFLASLIGPFASFLDAKQLAPILYNSSNFFKSILSFFFWFGFFLSFKERYYKIYPYIIFCSLNIFLVNASATSFDMRFQYTMIPFFYLISIYGTLNSIKKIKYFFAIYLFVVLLPVIFFYNQRIDYF